jgi:hypothetical protein
VTRAGSQRKAHPFFALVAGKLKHHNVATTTFIESQSKAVQIASFTFTVAIAIAIAAALVAVLYCSSPAQLP